MQLRVETYNTFNHPEFNGVNNTASYGSAPTSTSTLTQATDAETGGTFGQFTSAQNPRYVQLALRIDF
jgi:hypothetical protein